MSARHLASTVPHNWYEGDEPDVVPAHAGRHLRHPDPVAASVAEAFSLGQDDPDEAARLYVEKILQELTAEAVVPQEEVREEVRDEAERLEATLELDRGALASAQRADDQGALHEEHVALHEGHVMTNERKERLDVSTNLYEHAIVPVGSRSANRRRPFGLLASIGAFVTRVLHLDG